MRAGRSSAAQREVVFLRNLATFALVFIVGVYVGHSAARIPVRASPAGMTSSPATLALAECERQLTEAKEAHDGILKRAFKSLHQPHADPNLHHSAEVGGDESASIGDAGGGSGGGGGEGAEAERAFLLREIAETERKLHRAGDEGPLMPVAEGYENDIDALRVQLDDLKQRLRKARAKVLARESMMLG
mmetsp:Transcript_12478/g.41100  ORF Transcript_12478/g.41100 Transcript_12478/m.41100 type:complete len:189 (-) Transcript_12478:4101-4667(-)